ERGVQVPQDRALAERRLREAAMGVLPGKDLVELGRLADEGDLERRALAGLQLGKDEPELLARGDLALQRLARAVFEDRGRGAGADRGDRHRNRDDGVAPIPGPGLDRQL